MHFAVTSPFRSADHFLSNGTKLQHKCKSQYIFPGEGPCIRKLENYGGSSLAAGMPTHAGQVSDKEKYPVLSGWGLEHGDDNPIPIKEKHVQNSETMLAGQNQLTGCKGVKVRLSRPEEGCSITDKKTPTVGGLLHECVTSSLNTRHFWLLMLLK